jgi:hypothetical protein
MLNQSKTSISILCTAPPDSISMRRPPTVTNTNLEGKVVPVRHIGEQHVREDLGRIPSFQDWIAELPIQPWMYGRRLTVREEL